MKIRCLLQIHKYRHRWWTADNIGLIDVLKCEFCDKEQKVYKLKYEKRF
jgi:hypothetical protein